MTLQRLIFIPSSERTCTISEGPFPFDRSVSILVFFSCVSMAMSSNLRRDRYQRMPLPNPGPCNFFLFFFVLFF